MLMRTDPFRELDHLAQQFFGYDGTRSRPAVMPIDAYRQGDEFVVQFDLPGVAAEDIDLDVERNVLTVRAERQSTVDQNADFQVTERPRGIFSRQIFLGDTLNTEKIDADYTAGVLTLRIPVAEQAKPRKVAISSGDSAQQIESK